MNHTCSHEELMHFKTRWTRVEENHLQILDQKIVPLLIEINRIRLVSTVWSCEGHLDRNSIPGGNSGYIMLATTTPSALMQLYERVVEMLDDEDECRSDGFSLKMTRRKHVFRRGHLWWNAWVLSWPVTEAHPAEFWIGLMHDALKEMIDGTE